MNSAIKMISLCALAVACAACSRNKTAGDVPESLPEIIGANGVGFKMVSVPSATFSMGYNLQGGKVKNAAIHQVVIDGFAIGEMPVSQELWLAVTGSDPSSPKNGRKAVDRITLKDCRKFLRKLSKIAGYDFRLPTEAEWEYAVRKGFAKGSGAVYEYCSDKYSPDYGPDMDVNPKGPADGQEYVIRSPMERDGIAPTSKSANIGLRVAVSLSRPFDRKVYEIMTGGKSEREKGALKTESFNVGGVDFKMNAVSGGKFTMGATSEQASYGEKDELPVHEVTLDSFLIGETEVTVALWKAVMGYVPIGNSDLRKPVVDVSWYDAQMFIMAINKMTGRIFRLPTEAEWEFASRGGAKAAKCRFSGSDNVSGVAIFNTSEAAVVKSRKPNAIGLYDMSGNAWEWCEDYYGPYSAASAINPTGPAKGSERVMRGGSANSDWNACRVSNRSHIPACSVKTSFGFRLAM